MVKSLCFAAVVVVTCSALAEAYDNCCCSGGSAPATAMQPATPAPPVAQAQRPQATRSFSYQPAAPVYQAAPSYSRPLTNYSLNRYIEVDSGYRWDAASRPAAAKARGNY